VVGAKMTDEVWDNIHVEIDKIVKQLND